MQMRQAQLERLERLQQGNRLPLRPISISFLQLPYQKTRSIQILPTLCSDPPTHRDFKIYFQSFLARRNLFPESPENVKNETTAVLASSRRSQSHLFQPPSWPESESTIGTAGISELLSLSSGVGLTSHDHSRTHRSEAKLPVPFLHREVAGGESRCRGLLPN